MLTLRIFQGGIKEAKLYWLRTEQMPELFNIIFAVECFPQKI